MKIELNKKQAHMLWSIINCAQDQTHKVLAHWKQIEYEPSKQWIHETIDEDVQMQLVKEQISYQLFKEEKQ